MVIHTPRSTYDDRRLHSFDSTVLFHGRASAIAAHSLKGCIHGFENLVYLQSQFAGGYKHYSLNTFHIRFQTL